MTKRDIPIIVILSLLAAFIWLRDLSWITDSADTLPIMIALPTFIWLGSPWRFMSGMFRLTTAGLTLAVAGFTLGILTGWTFPLALGWTALLWSWISVRIVPDERQRINKLLILPFMAFPWLVLDAQTIGWWFRLSGSWAAGKFFSLAGFNALQEGTRLLVQGLPVDVSASCSGLNALQSMLIAGSALAYILLGHNLVYWFNLPLLIVVSWIANTLRIIAIALAALAVSPKFAAGLFHEWGGWLVLIVMFFLCWALFTLQKSILINKTTTG